MLDADDVALVPLMSSVDDPIDALVDSLVMVVLEVLGEDVTLLLLRREDDGHTMTQS